MILKSLAMVAILFFFKMRKIFAGRISHGLVLYSEALGPIIRRNKDVLV